jgi:O-antigen biosynthesis protein
VADGVAPKYRRWAVSPSLFDAHMAYLAKQGCTPLTVQQLTDLMNNKLVQWPKQPVVVTFDDGLADFYSGALPVLERYSFPATLYIATGYVGKTSRWLQAEGEGSRPMLTWAQIDDLRLKGIELGAHGHTHSQLDTLSDAQARHEIFESKAILERALEQPVSTFAYPHGYHSERDRQFVVEAGYKSACAVKHAMSSADDDRMALARIIVTADMTVEKLGHLLTGVGLPYALKRERLRTKIWRVVRRLKHGWGKVYDFAT